MAMLNNQRVIYLYWLNWIIFLAPTHKCSCNPLSNSGDPPSFISPRGFHSYLTPFDMVDPKWSCSVATQKIMQFQHFLNPKIQKQKYRVHLPNQKLDTQHWAMSKDHPTYIECHEMRKNHGPTLTIFSKIISWLHRDRSPDGLRWQLRKRGFHCWVQTMKFSKCRSVLFLNT